MSLLSPHPIALFQRDVRLPQGKSPVYTGDGATSIAYPRMPSVGECARWRSLRKAASAIAVLLGFEGREPHPIGAHAIMVFEKYRYKLPRWIVRCYHAPRIRVAAGDDLLVREIEERMAAVTDAKGRIHDQCAPPQRFVAGLRHGPEDRQILLNPAQIADALTHGPFRDMWFWRTLHIMRV
jgi:hypothetical protein